MNFPRVTLFYLSCCFVVLGLFVLCVGQLNAGIFGPSSYEECVLKEMKGRPDNQVRFVHDFCRKKFPAFPDYLDTSKVGVLNCSDTKRDFQLEIRHNELHTPWGNFPIKRRVPSYLTSENLEITIFEKWGKGTGIDINFEYGTVNFYSSTNHQNSYPYAKCSPN